MKLPPDLNEARKLSQIFNVSLDELTNNNIKDILITKVDNMESITKRIINILKIILLTVIIIIIILVSMLFFKDYFTVSPVSTMQSIECTIKDKEYSYQIWQNFETTYPIDKIITNDDNLKVNVEDYINFDDVIKAIKEDVQARGGTCKKVFK